VTDHNVLDAEGIVVSSASGQPSPALVLVGQLLRYAHHLPGCAPTGMATCSCGLSRVVQAAMALGSPPPHHLPAAVAPVSPSDAEAALLGGALGGLLGTLLRKSHDRENTRPTADRRPDRAGHPDGERPRPLVRKRRGR